MIVFSIAKGFHKLTKDIAPELSPKERDRLRAMILWDETKKVSLVCKTFGISRATIYRWLKRFDPQDIRSVKDKSRRPRWSYELIIAVKGLRQLYPRWGKEKLV